MRRYFGCFTCLTPWLCIVLYLVLRNNYPAEVADLLQRVGAFISSGLGLLAVGGVICSILIGWRMGPGLWRWMGDN